MRPIQKVGKVIGDQTALVNEVIKQYGGVKAVQVRFKYTAPMGVYNWRMRGIPKSLVAEIHMDTGIALGRLLQGAKPRVAA
jgi:hypothetical protein